MTIYRFITRFMRRKSDWNWLNRLNERSDINMIPCNSSTYLSYLRRSMTKPKHGMCAQRRHRSAWASAHSDQSLHCPHEETLGPQLPLERTAKTDQTGYLCSKSSLGAKAILFCHAAAHPIFFFFFFFSIIGIFLPKHINHFHNLMRTFIVLR